MSLVDTHCHIQSIDSEVEKHTHSLWQKNKNINPDKVIKDATLINVTKLICVGTSVVDSQSAVDFVSKRTNCWASVGIHPHETKNVTTEGITKLVKLAQSNRVIAIGECGLDYYYLHSNKNDQKRVFIELLNIAKTNNLPLIFHVRDGYDDFWKILEKFLPLRGVVHSFSDNLDNLNKALEKGLYIGVNGIVTFNKNEELQKAYASIPIDKLLLETDSPYLTPVPYRGSINEPKRVKLVAEFLANLYKVDLETLEKETTKNAYNLFGI